MSLAVSSWYVEQAAQTYLEPRRRLLLGGSDYSDYVLRWPAITTRLDTIDLGTATVGLSNIGRAFNSLVDGGALLTTSAEIALGLTHPVSGTEWAVLYTGQPSHVTFAGNGAELRMQLQGKTRTLTDLALGSGVTSAGIDYTTSAYYPADLAWFLVTSQGGLSAVQSAGNPDLDYAQWAKWRDSDVVHDVRVKAYFTGEKIYQVLSDLAELSGMGVGFASGRLGFSDIHGPFAVENALPMEQALDVSLTVDPARLTNQFTVEAAYNPGTGRFASAVTRVNSASQAQYGVRTGRFGPRGVWYAGANDGRYFAEDQVRFGRVPAPHITVRTSLAGGLHRTPGDVVTLTHTHLGITERQFRVVGQEVDLQEGTLRFELETAQHRQWEFLAQVSSVNLRVRTVTPVSSAQYLAVEESDTSGRVMRTDSAGVFQPVGVYGTALLSLDGQQVLIGGPPTSGSTQSVLRRSADGGASSVVVASLGPGTRTVHHLFEVHSGTCLASVSCGGILRSTDAGSSWNVTWTISNGYHVQRFLQPMSGTLWGATGYSISALTNGVYVWESVNDGVSWLPRHTVLSSGDFFANGFHAVSGSEYLLSTFGTGAEELMTLRGIRTSPASIAWSVVLSQVAFASVIRTDSGHLLMGFDEDVTLGGGAVYRSLDGGVNWEEDTRLSKQGNVDLVKQPDGTADGFVSRMSGGARTYRYRNYTPDNLS
jgi:hypothetical protein